MQADGNLVLYNNISGQAIWASGTNGKGSPPFFANYQPDYNFVLYDGTGKPLWASGTNGQPSDRLVMQDDGNLVTYLGTTPIWSTGTYGK
ncbi:putative mannose-binding lectin precursor [Polychytrium aggregatum]|uniref:putative mannose-binding lectin precursor n=1 Tax=Polychytrium aggregatum TaxID=110093 RepID=UPI0022FE2736|nr:putative mannose-binding lectin precursor [Polychytrium aggregatum]KAI9190665.1 putative mannose-binding lectin precursor [Polychytrium aggregatum]